MSLDTEIYFIHGWGYDGSIWLNWLPVLGNGVPCYIFDRGYFGPDKQIFSLRQSASLKVLIAHSFGLHLIPPQFFSSIHLLVLTSCFRYFHAESLNDKLSKRQIDLMKRRLLVDPQGVLKDFYLKCGLNKTQLGLPVINDKLLYDDLFFLDNNRIDLDHLAKIPHIILLHGAADNIVSPEHSNSIHKHLSNSKLYVHDQAEHALPITNAQWCLDIIKQSMY